MTDENNMELESSTSFDEQTPVDSPSEGGDSADSTPAGNESVDAREGLLAVVQDAVQPKDDKQVSASQADEGTTSDQDAQSSDGGEPATPAARSDDEFADVPFNKHPRFQQLVRQRNEFRQGHEQYQQIQKFLDDNGLSADAAAEMLQIGALMDRNPAKALEMLRPRLQKLVQEAGAILPQDLQDDVRQGRITKERAQEIAQLRAKQQSAQRDTDFQRQQEERRRQMQLQDNMRTAAVQWQESTRLKNADAFTAAAEEELMREIAFRHARGDKPKDPEGVREQLDDAWKAVQKRLVPPASPKKPIHPVRGGRAPATQTSEPKSILDIVQSHSS